MELSKNAKSTNEVLAPEALPIALGTPSGDVRPQLASYRSAMAALLLASFLAPSDGLGSPPGKNDDLPNKKVDANLADCVVKPPKIEGLDPSLKWKMVSGECRDGLAAGYGSAVMYDGDGDPFMSYRGGFSEGEFHGHGAIKQGEAYEGQMTYTGEWGNGSMVKGFGSITSQDGKGDPVIKYRGEVQGAEPEGYGIMQIFQPDGALLAAYTGEFADGAPKGMGVQLKPGEGMWYGQFGGEKLNGWGSYRESDKGLFFGEFRDGQLHGKCACVDPEKLFIGECKDGQVDGEGGLLFFGGGVFHGEFVGGKSNGYGVHVNRDGSTLKGPFEDGEISRKCINGPGSWELNVGDCSGGLANGPGIATNTDEGRLYEAEFDNGAIVSSTPLNILPGGNPPLTMKRQAVDPDALKSLLQLGPSVPALELSGPFTSNNFDNVRGFDTFMGRPNVYKSGPSSFLGTIPGIKMPPLLPSQTEGVEKAAPGYYGEMKFGVPHGYGSVVGDNFTYFGELAYGKASGYGVGTTPVGTHFGKRSYGELDGLGLLARPNGTTYLGEWADGKKSGMGNALTQTAAEFGELSDGSMTGTRIRIELDKSVPEFFSIIGPDEKDGGSKKMDLVRNDIVISLFGPDGKLTRGAQMYADGMQIKTEVGENGIPQGREIVFPAGAGVLKGRWIDDKFDAGSGVLKTADSQPETLQEIYRCAKVFAAEGGDAAAVAVFLYNTLMKNYPGTAVAKTARTELRKLKGPKKGQHKR